MEEKIKFRVKNDRVWNVLGDDGKYKTYIGGQEAEEFKSNVESAVKAGTVEIVTAGDINTGELDA